MIDESNDIAVVSENRDSNKMKKGLNEECFEAKHGKFLNNKDLNAVESRDIHNINVGGDANKNNIYNKKTSTNIEREKIFKSKKKNKLSENNLLKLENKKEVSLCNGEEENKIHTHNKQKEIDNLIDDKSMKKENSSIKFKVDNRRNKEKYSGNQNIDRNILNKEVSSKNVTKKKEKNNEAFSNKVKEIGIMNKENNAREDKKDVNNFKEAQEKSSMKETTKNKKEKNTMVISNKKNVTAQYKDYNECNESLNSQEKDNSSNMNNDKVELKKVDIILENAQLNNSNSVEKILHKNSKTSKEKNNIEKTELKKVESTTEREFSNKIHDESKLKIKILEKNEQKNINIKKIYEEKCENGKGFTMNEEKLDNKKEDIYGIEIKEDKQFKKEYIKKNEASVDTKNKIDILLLDKKNRKKKINSNTNEEASVCSKKKKKNNNFTDENVTKESKESDSINNETIYEKKKGNSTNFSDEHKTKDKKCNNNYIDESNKKEHTINKELNNDNKYQNCATLKENYEEILKKNDSNKSKESSVREFTENNGVFKESNENKGGNVKKKYTRLLKSLQTNLTTKIINKECEKRIKSWGENVTLQEKINYFINNKIATKTEYKYGKKPNTLSICNQFSLYNHLTMLNDFNRLHYYRAAMRWTGHNDSCDSTNNNFTNNENNSITADYVNSMSNTINFSNTCNGENTNSLCNTESINSMSNTININNIDGCNLSKFNDNNKINNPDIFFENNKGCYVYNKNIIEIGTGPLSLLSINAILNGAKHVDALEVNKDASDMAKKLIEGYNLEDYIKIINCYSKVFEYKEEEHQRRLKKKNSLYNFLDNSFSENFCNNFNYDLIISEVIGDFASQEGVADIYLDLHKKIFSYRKYQEYLHNWNNNNNRVGYAIDTTSKEEKKSDMDNEKKQIENENIVKKEKKLSYSEFSANEELYNSEEFYNMNIKSIPYSVTTYYCPVKFPYSDNIIYKSENYPERTIISPQNKLLQSVILDWSNLTLNEKENSDDNYFGVLEYLYLEQNLKNQVLQKRSNIFHIQKNAPFCGFLITIDVEIRKGEHFGTKYGTCDSWYTNIVLLKDEIKVEKDDLIINKTYTNLLNYSENIIDRKTVLVSRPSYTFYGYILRLIKEKHSDSALDSDDMNSSYDKNFNEQNDSSSESNYIYLDDETILLLDQKDFHTKFLSPNLKKENNEDISTNEELKTNDNISNKIDNSVKVKKDHFSQKKSNILESSFYSQDNDKYSDNTCHYRNMDIHKNISDNKCISGDKYHDGNTLYFSATNKENSNHFIKDKNKTKTQGDTIPLNRNEINCKNGDNELNNKSNIEFNENNNNKDYDNFLNKKNTNNNSNDTTTNAIKSENKNNKSHEEIPKNNSNKKRKRDMQKGGHKSKKTSDKSKEEYEKDISDIINNYKLYSKYYYENLKSKIIVYKNFKYKFLSFYEPVVIDYDEQATVIYKKDDIYNSRENNVNKFVNNVYQ